MRWVFLALLFVSLPVIVAYAGKGLQNRDRLLLALGLLLFSTGTIALDASIISWRTWPGISRGIILSFVDTIAIALIATRRGRFSLPPFLGLCVLLFVPMTLATLTATVKLAAAFSVLQFAQLVLLYVAIAPELERTSAVHNLLKGMALGLIVQAGYVIQQKLTGVIQAGGTTPHQNILGMMVQLSALPLIAAALEGMRSKLVYAGIFAATICIAGGGSRASIGFFALGVALLLVVSLVRRTTPRKWAAIGAIAAAVAIATPLTLGTLRDRFGENEIVTGDRSREDLERAARAIASDHPLGVGPNNFVTINNTQGYAVRAGMEWGAGTLDKPVHNAYLLARAESGWAGQIGLFLLIGGVAFAGFRTGFRLRKIETIGISLGCACGITTVALHSNYEYAWYLVEVQRLFFVNAALIAACMAVAAKTERQLRTARVTPAPTSQAPVAAAAQPAAEGVRPSAKPAIRRNASDYAR